MIFWNYSLISKLGPSPHSNSPQTTLHICIWAQVHKTINYFSLSTTPNYSISSNKVPLLAHWEYSPVTDSSTSSTGDLLPVSLIRYRRLFAFFLGSITGDFCLFLGSPYSDNFSLISCILKLKEGINEFFTLCKVFEKVISLIYIKIHFGDRIPLSFWFPTDVVGGWFQLHNNIATLWLHLASWNLPDSQHS